MTISQDMFHAFAKFQVLLYHHIFEWEPTSFAPVTQFFLCTLTWASHSSALMHSVGTHVEYTCQNKTQVTYNIVGQNILFLQDTGRPSTRQRHNNKLFDRKFVFKWQDFFLVFWHIWNIVFLPWQWLIIMRKNSNSYANSNFVYCRLDTVIMLNIITLLSMNKPAKKVMSSATQPSM